MDQVVIEEYSSDWTLEYQKEAVKVKKVFGDRLLGIEHIGSTSVEGLGAKPVIDFMVGISDLAQAEELIEPLLEIGYEHVFKENFPNRRFFRKGQWKAGTHHLHIYKYGSEEWNNNILFNSFITEILDKAKGNNDLLGSLKYELLPGWNVSKKQLTKEKWIKNSSISEKLPE